MQLVRGGASRHTANRCAGYRGFTLIELLVVVSIIALLIAILLPSLKRAREQAKQAVCLANLKGIGTAAISYAYSDVQEMVIPVHPLFETDPTGSGYYDWGGKSGKGEPSVDGVPATSRWGTGEGRGPGTRPLNHFLIKGKIPDHRDDPGPNQINWTSDADMDFPIMRCPSDRGYPGFHLKTLRDSGMSSFEHFGTSYASNGIWTTWKRESYVVGFAPFLRRLTQIPNPGETLLFLENCARFAWYFDHDANSYGYNNWGIIDDGIDTSSSQIRGWHRKPFSFDVAFADGHAAQTTIRGRIIPPPRLPRYPIDPEDAEENGDPQAWWQIFNRIIIRGHGWRIDCLPAPLTREYVPSLSIDINAIFVG